MSNLKVEVFPLISYFEVLPSATVLWSEDKRSWEVILSWFKISVVFSWKV